MEIKGSSSIALLVSHSAHQSRPLGIWLPWFLICVNFFYEVILLFLLWIFLYLHFAIPWGATLPFNFLIFWHTFMIITTFIDFFFFPMLKGILKCYSNSSLKSLDSHSNVFCGQVWFIAFTSVVLLFLLISLNFRYVFCVLLMLYIRLHRVETP